MGKKLTVISLVLVILPLILPQLTPTLTAAEKKESGIISEGLGVITDDDISKARESAISDALGLALEQRLGMILETEREIKNHALMSSRIRSEAKGTIESYDILDEKRFDYTYWVKLRVLFKKDIIEKEELDTIRVIVVTDESIEGEVSKADRTNCKIAVTEKLVNSGLKVIEPGTSLWFLWDEDSAKKIAKSQALGADLVVLVRAKAKQADKFGDLYVYKCDAESKVVKPYAAEIIAATKVSIRGERKLETDEAAESAMTVAGQKSAEYVLDKIIQRAESLLTYRIIVTGIANRWQVDQIVKSLSKKDGTKHVSSGMLSKTVAALDVDLNSVAKEKLSYNLEHLGGINLRVVRESYGWIEAKVYEAD